MSYTESDRIAEELYQQPDVEQQIEHLSAKLKSEKQRRTEFYEWLDEDKKAEFINGEIVIHSPVLKRHADATLLITMMLKLYVRRKRLGYVATEKVLVKLKRNDFEPDIVFWHSEEANTFREDQLFFPAPDLVAEVLSPSTEHNNRTTKKESYAANGVSEYWIVDSAKRTIERYLLKGETYELIETLRGDKMLHSEVVEGFSVPLAAAFEEDANDEAIEWIMSLPKVRQ